MYALVESSTIYADDDPCLTKKIVGLFELSDVFESVRWGEFVIMEVLPVF